MTTELVDIELNVSSRTDLDTDSQSIDAPKGPCHSIQSWIQPKVEHIGFRVLIMLLIFIDLIVLIVDLAISPMEARMTLDIVSLVFSCIFLVELILRIISRGISCTRPSFWCIVNTPPSTVETSLIEDGSQIENSNSHRVKRFFIVDIVNIVDSIVIVLTFIVCVVVVSLEPSNLSTIKILVAGRFIRLPRVVVLIRIFYTERKMFATASRRLISENKQRFRNAGFDLDLCYITDRVIATSFPSSGFQAMYRNPISEVARFLDTFHKGHYKIYNMCSERSYDPSYFHGQVGRVRIDDHNPPLLEDMIEFAESARTWMGKDSRNVLVVHCKGGKGRTGTMICTHLIDNGTFHTAQEVLDYFGMKRTDFTAGKKFQGVETPSQSRYVGYFERLKNELNFQIPEERIIRLKSLEMYGMKNVGIGDASDFYFEVFEGRKQVHTVDLGDLVTVKTEAPNVNANAEKNHNQEQVGAVSPPLHFDIPDCPPLSRDVKVKFYCKSKQVPKEYENCAFFFWFHTGFLTDSSLSLDRTELDNPHKKKMWKIYREDFKIVLNFE